MLQPTVTQEDADHQSHGLGRPSRPWSRRGLLGGGVALGGAMLLGLRPAWAADERLRWTAADDLGPFYPQSLTPSEDFDLTMMAGHKAAALGQALYVSGRIVNPRGEPVPHAVIEIWQANAVGRYSHPGDDSKAPLDPNFQGFARLRSGSDGSYSFKTVQPGLYTGRTRHIHFDVRGRNSRLVTQMYFEGEPRNQGDPLLKAQSVEGRKTLMSRPGVPSGKQERNALVVDWDIVLAFG